MRLIDADALKKEWSMGLGSCDDCPQNTRRCQYDVDFSRMDICQMIDEAPTVGSWISVEDRLPEENLEYLVYATDEDGERFVTTDHWNKYVRQWYLFDNGSSTTVTHWMPLPEPPGGLENEL